MRLSSDALKLSACVQALQSSAVPRDLTSHASLRVWRRVRHVQVPKHRNGDHVGESVESSKKAGISWLDSKTWLVIACGKKPHWEIQWLRVLLYTFWFWQTLHKDKLFGRFITAITVHDHSHDFICSGLMWYLNTFVGCLRNEKKR